MRGRFAELNVHLPSSLKEVTVREDLGAVDSYERRYGKDAAKVAKDVVAFAASNEFDIVIINTAS